MTYGELQIGQKFLFDPTYSCNKDIYIVTDVYLVVNMRTGYVSSFDSDIPILPLDSNDVMRRLYNGHNSL